MTAESHETGPLRPQGEVYDWYHRAMDLLNGGNPAAAAQLLSHAIAEEPRSRSIREALARAQFGARRYAEALATFRSLAEEQPDDHYAQFGWGLAAWRLRDFQTAAEHLALAVAMRPDLKHYQQALRQVRATLRVRQLAAQDRRRGPDRTEP
ncbi:hypothetical protein C3Y87_17635 [Carbonactinospora thermoautotrophica]|nr:hypothetical protein [Carbonactinospora thermoautotrophica]